MRIACFGGSFNPVHLGHLFAADTAITALGYDRVVMIPAYRSPFKLDVSGMEDNSRVRLEMLAASVAGDPRLAIDGCEIRREGVSYTADTLRDVIRRYQPDGKPGLIIGDDLAAEFPRWHDSAAILEMADIVIVRRVHSGRLEYPYPFTQIENEVMDISSAMIRERIAGGGAWRSLAPAAARTIIEERGLYGFRAETQTGSGTAAEGGAMPAARIGSQLIIRVENAARETLPADRFLHSRNTALLAWDLCRRFGLDPQAGYLAGIAHDMGKPLDGKELLSLAKKDGRRISKLEKKKPSLLHGRAAAILLKERFGVHNEDVLEAVALHTEGGEGMGPLAKIIYIADKLEVSREKADFALRKMCYTENDLEQVFLAVLDNTVSWLRSKKVDLSAETFRLLEKMKGKQL